MNEVVQANNNAISIIDSVNLDHIQTTMNKIAQLQAVVQGTLKENHDYGTIPGTNKPTLLKPGAEKILMLFGLASEYELIEKIQDYDKGFFAYTVKCTLLKNGEKITEGVGSCNTKEKKYVNQDAYTLANTCLKMAKKRAQIDASLTVGSLSEIFTQDIEDMQEYMSREQVETMTVDDAANFKLTFGKHRGETLGELYKSDLDYLEWLHKADRTDARIKKAIDILKNAAKEAVEKKKQALSRSVEQETSGAAEEEISATTEQSNDYSYVDQMQDDDLPFS